MRLSFLSAHSPLQALLLLPTLVVALNRTTEQGEATINNPTQECAVYYYPPVAKAFAAGRFPPLWTPATIVPNDTNAMAKFQSIQSQIPAIQPNGRAPQSHEGNWTNYTYPSADPNCWWTYSTCTTPKHPGLAPDLAAAPEPGTLGYGFDDGPNCSHNAFYDFLRQNNQKATMFYIGSNVADWPLEAQRGLADGHEICVRKYTWSHRYTTSLTNEQVFAEFYYTMEIIKLVIGITPTCWRPPFGDVDDRVRAIAHALGLRTIIWRYDSNDWRAGTGNITYADVDANYEALIARAQNGTYDTGGTIMLTHELNNFTMSEAMKYYDRLKAVFKYLVPMGVATNQSQPYVETNYSLPNFEQYIAGTTTLAAAAPTSSSTTQSTSNSSNSSNSSSHQAGKNSAASSYRTVPVGGLAVSAAFVAGLLKLLM